MEALRDMNLPPGFGFHPSDAELISHYLKRKVLGQKIEYELIPEIDIYKHEPWDLPAKCNFPIEDNKWHFFASRDRKYPTGVRSNRATIAGYWKSTGKDRAIKLNKRTLGTKKTLVFHEGRPPSGKRTEWIMHEYYIDENECQANPDMKDAFVLCRVTRRDEWALENDNEVGKRNPHPLQLDAAAAATSVVSAVKPEDTAAASVICPAEPNHVAASVASAEQSNDVAMTPTSANTPNGEHELQAWLEELFDPSFNPVVDAGSADLFVTEQHAESSNLQNPGSLAPKIEPDHASPIQNGTDVTDYLLPDDIHSILYPGTDDFGNTMFLEQADQAGIAFGTNQVYSMMGMNPFTLPNNFEGGTQEELQFDQENSNPNLPNEIADSAVTIRRRHVTTSVANISPAAGRMKMQVGVRRMVTSNSESINQTVKFSDNSGRRLDLMTNVEHLLKHGSDATSTKQHDGAKQSEDNNNLGYFRGIKHTFSYSPFRFKVFFAVCMIGVAAVIFRGLLVVQ